MWTISYRNAFHPCGVITFFSGWQCGSSVGCERAESPLLPSSKHSVINYASMREGTLACYHLQRVILYLVLTWRVHLDLISFECEYTLNIFSISPTPDNCKPMFPTVSKTSSILEETYTTLSPLLFPPPSTFPYPLIESFAAAHDPLTEAYGQKLFTASMALREAGVQVERATAARNMADLPGEQPTTSDSNVGPPHKELSLAEVKKSRLRAKLQSVNQPLSVPY